MGRRTNAQILLDREKGDNPLDDAWRRKQKKEKLKVVEPLKVLEPLVVEPLVDEPVKVVEPQIKKPVIKPVKRKVIVETETNRSVFVEQGNIKDQITNLLTNAHEELKKTDEGKAKLDKMNEGIMKHTLDMMADEKYKYINIEDRKKLAQILVNNMVDDDGGIEFKGIMMEYQMVELMIEKAKTKDKLNDIIQGIANKDLIREKIKMLFLKDIKFK